MSNNREINLAEKARDKELERILFNNSSILKSLPYPVEIYEKNNAMRALYFLPYTLTEKPIINFLYLYKKVFLRIDPDAPGFDIKGIEFRERINKNEKARERIENDFVKEFAQVLERNYLIKELCWKKYQPETIKDFKELKMEDPQLFFENLFKYIDDCGRAKDILIIADRKTYRFIKQKETGRFLESYVSNVLEANLENKVKFIIVSQKGILIPYYISRIKDNYREKDYHYLNISYEINLMDKNPIILFEERNADKNST